MKWILLVKPIVVIVLLWATGRFSLWLQNYSDLSELSLMTLLTMSFILSILLPNINQLKSFSIAKGEIILQQVTEKEENVKQVAIATARVARLLEKEALILPLDGTPSEIIPAIEKLEELVK
ncbi:hypothetical protein [Agarivorans gilvus]|uniref:Uncharacterized protein n=1 Tax=Agarivorans gilvus TaxID=680279 RepID=A0ABQ1I438_9ALTE|nr:hypothetical protein [Agarivorans gilvus]GGB11406.1 hypothetical protein GCM10007414_26120 [Agarivorans gilvus]